MSERRSQVRLFDSELVMVGWRAGPTDLKQLGNVVDVSLGGIALRVDQALPLGTTVEISYGFCEDDSLTGTVKHVSERPEGYFLGVEFASDSKDSALHFRPELLIEPF